MNPALTTLPVAALLMVASACSDTSRYGDYSQHDSAGFSIDETISHVVVDSEVGDVTLWSDDGDALQVDAEISWRNGPTPELDWRVEGNTLYVQTWCPDNSDCRVDLDLVVPNAFDADIATDVGTIEARGVSCEFFEGTVDVGSVLLDLTTRPTAVRASTDVGEVVVQLPAGAYDITTDTVVGSVTMDGVMNDSSEADSIRAISEVGDVRVLGR